MPMKRKDFFELVAPLSEKLYLVAYSLIPDDLQAEQLVIDGLNAFLIKEKKSILRKEFNTKDSREAQVLRKIYFKGILNYLAEIGVRRSIQMQEQTKTTRPAEFATFYNLEPKVRLIVSLRYECQFNIEEIEEIARMPRYEVIEKIHNGKFLMMNDLNRGVDL